MRRPPLSLAAKALGLQLAGILAVAAVVGVTRYHAIRTQLYREIERSAEGLIQVVEDMLTERPDLLRPGTLDAVVDRFTYKLPSVARVSLVDPGFRVLADSRLAVGDPADQTALLPLLRRVGEGRFFYETQGRHYLRVSRSLRGRYDPARRSDIVGAVSIDMQLALTDAAIARALAQEMTLVVVLLLPIGAVLYGITRRRFVRPLEQLAEAGSRFARGEVPAPLAFADGDELDAVARSFNQMVAERTRELHAVLAEVRTLRGMIRICSSCKRVLTDEGIWQQIESYVRERSDAEFSHGVCPECARAVWDGETG